METTQLTYREHADRWVATLLEARNNKDKDVVKSLNLKQQTISTAMRLLVSGIENVATCDLREGVKETPERATKAWEHWTGGYAIDPVALLKCFADGSEGMDEMVLVKDIPFYSKCEHHMADIIGRATIGYIPNGKVVGLSKLSRVVDAFARRLQVQERITVQIADTIFEGLNAKGVGVMIRARHMCMESRGICQQGHSTVTQALRGVMRDQDAARAEFISLARSDVPL